MTSTVLIKRDSAGLMKLDRETLIHLFQRNHGGARKIATIGVIGLPKSGKSFLLNYIMRFFKNERKGVINCMNDKNPQKALEGFPWNCPTEASDMISIWSEPFIIDIEEKEKEKLAVFLLEFGCSEDVLPHFQTFALRTCSFLIFNEIGTIPSCTLNNLLHNFMDSKVNESFTFPHVAFLVRDALPDTSKVEERKALDYLLEKFRNFVHMSDHAELPTVLKNITFAFLPKPNFSHPNFQGECAALGDSFRKPFGNFISEVVGTEMKCFDDGNMYSSIFDQEEMNVNGMILESLLHRAKKDQEVQDTPEPMETGDETAAAPRQHSSFQFPELPAETESEFKDVNGGQDQCSAVTMSKVSRAEADMTLAASGPETSFVSPSQMPPEAKFSPPQTTSVSEENQESVIPNISNYAIGTEKATSSYFPAHISVTTSEDSKKKVDAASKPIESETDNNRVELKRRSNSLPGYEAAQAVMESSDSMPSSTKVDETASPKLNSTSKVPNEDQPQFKSSASADPLKEEATCSVTPSTQVTEVKFNTKKEKTAAIKHIEATKNKLISGFVSKLKAVVAKETDLKKMEEEYLKLEKLVLPNFRQLCIVQGANFVDEIDKATEELELSMQEHWETVSKQHIEDLRSVESATIRYEQVYTEAVKAALIACFSGLQTPSYLNTLIGHSRHKAEAAVGGKVTGKFRAGFEKNIQAAMENVNKQAKIVANLVSTFQQSIEKKFNMFTCLSDEEFTKCASEFKTNALKAFSDFKDSEFQSVLENLLTMNSQKLEQRNRNIRQCENRVARAAIQRVIDNFYTIEMENFCNKKVHTTQGLKEFHDNLSRAAIEYFVSACRFNAVSGLSNEEYAAKLKNQFQTVLSVFISQNSINVAKASTMLSKFTSKAKSEYKKIMGEKLNRRSVSEYQLRQFHESTLEQALAVFKLDIKEVAENCEEEVESLRSHIDKYFPDWQEENAEMRQREGQKEAAERAAHDRLLEEQEQARREKEARIQAEVKKRRQTEAAKKEQAKANSYKSRHSEKPNVGETSFQNKQSTGTAAGGGNLNTKNEPNAIAIELGLKFVRAGFMNSQGMPELIPLEAKLPPLASFIGVNDKDIVFGEEARCCIQSISLADLVTEMNVIVERMLIIEGEPVQLRFEHIIAILLTHVKQKCEQFLGSSVSRAIITIPGWYNHELRRATKDAAFLAGFVENRLISEASAVGIAWYDYNHQQLQIQQHPGSSAKILAAVVSDFSFDVAGFEVDKKSVVMKKNVGRMNVCMGIRNTYRTKFTNWWYGSTGVDPAIIVQKSTFPYDMLADQAVFVNSIGYEGKLTMECLNKYSKDKEPIFFDCTQINGAILYSGPLRHLELKEVTTYSLICKDWTGKMHKICEPNEFLCALGRRKFDLDLTLSIFPSTRVRFDILEKLNDVEKLIGSVSLDPPSQNFKKFKMTFFMNPEGILSVEAKYGLNTPGVDFKTNNLNDVELVDAEELIAGLLKSEEKAKAEKSRQEAFQNLKAIEQALMKSIDDSKKLLEILKPAILKNIDKIVEGIVESSSLEVLQEAVEKLTKYSEKYCKE